MVTYMTQAIAWAVARVLRRPRNERVPHSNLYHAHWDRAQQLWYTHEHTDDDPGGRAA